MAQYITPYSYLASKNAGDLFRASGTPSVCYFFFEASHFQMACAQISRPAPAAQALFDEKQTRRLVIGHAEDVVVALILLDIGAPLLAFVMEILIELGIQTFILSTRAGSLHSRIPIGSLFLIDDAVSENGVTNSYFRRRKTFTAAADVNTILCRSFRRAQNTVLRCTSVSTDAFFRESHLDVKRWKSLDAEIVEMEAATAFALGLHHKVGVGTIGTVSDILENGIWSPIQPVDTAQRSIIEGALLAAPELAGRFRTS